MITPQRAGASLDVLPLIRRERASVPASATSAFLSRGRQVILAQAFGDNLRAGLGHTRLMFGQTAHSPQIGRAIDAPRILYLWEAHPMDGEKARLGCPLDIPEYPGHCTPQSAAMPP